jgi:acyl-CoA synthetase (AMP-forming)/AMP-acid ligase II
MNIVYLLDTNAEQHPAKIALVHKGRRISYQELCQESKSAAAFFTEHGLRPDHRALLFIPLSIELYVLFLGLVRIGVTVVLVDPSAGQKFIKSCLESIKPDAFVATPKAHLLRFIGGIHRVPHKFSTKFWVPGSTKVELITGSEARYQSFPTPPEHPALITFTSGSTGLPKAISRSHGFLINQHQAIKSSIPTKPDEVELNTLPVFILSNLASGMTTVLPNCDVRNPGRINAKKIVDQMKAEGVNRLLASPAFCKSLSDFLETNRKSMSSIQSIYTGGGPVFPNLFQQLSASFPNAAITAVFGSTEAEPIAHISLLEISEAELQGMQSGKGLLAGLPISEIKLAIIPDRDGFPIGPFSDRDFHDLVLPPHMHGEIVVAGDHVLKSYLSGDSTLTKFRVQNEIWHRTGDAGYLDSHGKLWLLGRCSAKISRSGTIVYPFGMEAAAMSLGPVKKAALIDQDGLVTLVVETQVDDQTALIEQLKKNLKQIDRVVLLKQIPVDARHNSKVLYSELKKLL